MLVTERQCLVRNVSKTLDSRGIFDSFSEQWFHCSPERCDIGEVLVKNLCWMIFTPIVCFASSHRSWLIHCYTAILQWDIASNYSVADVHWSTCSPWHQLFWRSDLWWFTSLEGNNIISFSLCWITNRAENVSAQWQWCIVTNQFEMGALSLIASWSTILLLASIPQSQSRWGEQDFFMFISLHYTAYTLFSQAIRYFRSVS